MTLIDSPAPTGEGATDETIGMPARVLLAALAASAGAVHLAMAPVHAAESTLDGVLFALAGWAQIALAIAVVARPSRKLLAAGIVANLAIVAAWAVSRTVGLPFGHGGVEPVGGIDLFTVGVEAGFVLLAGIVATRPATLREVPKPALAIGAVLPAALLVASTVAIASPSATQHGHGSEDVDLAAGADHAHGAGDDHAHAAGDDHAHDATATAAAERCDLGFNPASYWKEADMLGLVTSGGHDHGGDAHGGAGHEAHPSDFPQPSETLAKLIKMAKSDSEVDAGIVVSGLGQLSDEEYHQWLMSLHGSHDDNMASGAGDDNHGHGGHQGPQPWIATTDQAQCQALSNDLERARQVALAVPTAADAKAAGYVQVTPYLPGIAAHYMNFKYVDGTFELEKPEMVLYDGNADTSTIVGLSYYVVKPGETEPTQGFTGDQDHYHRHVGLCVRGAMVIADTTTSKEECEAMGGRKQDGGAGWMSHAWVVPGCESPWGVFSGANPILDHKMGERSDQGLPGCGASAIKATGRYDLKPGGTSPPPTVPGGSSEQAAGR